MKIHILHNLKSYPWGGGNQFLKALRKQFTNQSLYEHNLEKADVILLNSFPFGAEHLLVRLLLVKLKHPNKIVLHRLDGPISIVRGKDQEVDDIITIINNLFVDGTVFQSKWSREQNKKLFSISSTYEIVIYNAPDNEIFNSDSKKKCNPQQKIKLVANSWSPNWRKGFHIYKYLDENLNFSTYSMTFVGNSPATFKNIKSLMPVPSEELAEILSQNDIYITASKNEPCSNSLIEALASGLPAVALNSGGNPEIVQKAGALFLGKEDVMGSIEKVAASLRSYQSIIPEFSMKKTARHYYQFAARILNDSRRGKYQPKRIHFVKKINFLRIAFMIFRWRLKNKLRFITKKYAHKKPQ